MNVVSRLCFASELTDFQNDLSRTDLVFAFAIDRLRNFLKECLFKSGFEVLIVVLLYSARFLIG